MPITHQRAVLLKRGLVDGLLGGDDSTSSTTTGATSGSTGNGGGLVGGLTSGLGDLTSAVGGLSTAFSSSSSSSSSSVSTVSSSSATATTTAASSSGTSSTASSTTSKSSATTTSSSSTSASSVSSTSTTSSSTPSPQPDSQSETTTYLSTSGGETLTITNTIAAESSAAATAAGTHQSFLQNKALSGAVFALAGVVGLVIIVVISTWFIRRSHKRRLLDDAEKFENHLFPQHDPDSNLGYASEKRDVAGSDSGHSNNSGGGRRPLSDGTMRSFDRGSAHTNGNQYTNAPPGLTGPGAGGPRPAFAPPSQNAYATGAYDSPYGGIAYNQPPQYGQSQVSLSRAPTQNTVMSGWGQAGGGANQYSGAPGPPPVPQVNARADFASPASQVQQQGPGARAGGLNFTGV